MVDKNKVDDFDKLPGEGKTGAAVGAAPATGKRPAKKAASRAASKAATGASGGDGFDDDFETLEITFPPIFSFLKEGDTLTFIPRGTSEGPNGTLILCDLVNNKGEGEFVLRDEAYDLKPGDKFALGVKTVFIGDNKLITSDTKGQFTQVTQYCNENDRPVRLIYKGKQKSGSGFRYDMFDIQFTKDVMQQFYSN